MGIFAAALMITKFTKIEVMTIDGHVAGLTLTDSVGYGEAINVHIAGEPEQKVETIDKLIEVLNDARTELIKAMV